MDFEPSNLVWETGTLPTRLPTTFVNIFFETITTTTTGYPNLRLQTLIIKKKNLKER